MFKTTLSPNITINFCFIILGGVLVCNSSCLLSVINMKFNSSLNVLNRILQIKFYNIYTYMTCAINIATVNTYLKIRVKGTSPYGCAFGIIYVYPSSLKMVWRIGCKCTYESYMICNKFNIIIQGRPWLNRDVHCSHTTNVDAYAGAGWILSCASMRLWCLVPTDWRWFMICPQHSIYRLCCVESTINQQFKKTKTSIFIKMNLVLFSRVYTTNE